MFAPLPVGFANLKETMQNVVGNVRNEVLEQTEYCFDVCRAMNGAHIELL
jgi:hypothetical protein